MFETPYQTTPCARFDMGKTIESVRKLEIQGLLLPTDQPGIVMVPPARMSDFPGFQQPLTKLEGPTFEADIILDGRSLLRANGTPEKLDVYNHHVLTGVLTRMWYQGDRSVKRDFLQTSDFLAKVFVSWVGTALGSKLQLDHPQLALFRAMVAIYWVQLHTPLVEHSTAQDEELILSRASKYTPVFDAVRLGAAVGKVPPLNNLTDFVAWVKIVMNSPRLDQLTVGFMYPFLNYSWGVRSREAVAVALEYPPMFMALVYTTCLARSYTRTSLGAVIERVIERQADKDFIKNVNHLIGGR